MQQEVINRIKKLENKRYKSLYFTQKNNTQKH
ncbi:MAG: hypothetical protein K0S31_3040 [Sphingobacterium multivorum]|jgi:hypothetical protein|nr:hypothetical protein [Sphingobacterium multivorum]